MIIVIDSDDEGETIERLRQEKRGLEKELGTLQGDVAILRGEIRDKILNSSGFKREIIDRALSKHAPAIVVRRVTRLTASTWIGRLTGA